MPRRSLVLPQDGPPEGEAVDTTVERRMRRSIIRSSLAPNDLRRSVLTDNAQRTNAGASGTPGSAPPVSPQVFFNCLKLAAENKINAKNAFSLAMIDYLSYAVKSGNSPLSNFQLAGCSLDAGTKIYAARVDHVAGGMAEFAMSMSMMHKKAQAKAAEGDDGDMEMGDEEEQGAAKKKKKKGKSRSMVIVRDVKELMMDMSKTIPKNKMFSIVGNLMDEAIDSAAFSFCDRSNVGSVKDMTPAQLEEEKGDFLPVNTMLPTLSEECDLCPSLSNFKFGTIENSLDWSHLASNRTSRRNTRIPQATDSPRLTLSQQNLDPGLDEAAAQPFDEPDDFQNFTMGGGTIIEEVAACGAARRLEVVADNDDNFEFSVRLPESSFAISFQINENELRPLHGPFFWKYKRPTLRNTVQNSERPPPTTARKNQVDDEPVDFDGPMPDLTKLMKKRSKTYLSRDTLLRWNPDRHVLPTEDCEDAIIVNDIDASPSILDVGMVVGLKIPSLDPNKRQKATAEGADNQGGSQKVPYDFDNVADKQDYCPFPDQPLMPSDDEDDVELGQDAMEDDGLDDAEAMQNLFQLLNDSNVGSSQFDDIFSESHLLPEPANVVATMAPVWKTMRGINMRLMEALLWKQIDAPEQSEKEKLSGRWKLRQLREGLPKRTQNSASVTTTLYALLNLANKKGLLLQANPVLSKVTVQRLNGKGDKSRRSRVHPALLSN